ncbi:MAG TPA: zinc-binding alcohol dehydrogenase [Candidatus Dormibacteraeota bacterium]|jgi:threonine dehydrogenase-like Zn-dependent dehydrogenase|nr:zinc-binding alcohol dehydrogenase [Candidatus Dormibacteraeota bacterium]
MPRELIAVSTGRIEFREYEEPSLAATQVRVRTDFAAAKHGTEGAMVRGYAAARGPWDEELQLFDTSRAAASAAPVAVGNMFVGTAVEVGSEISGIRTGDRVLGYGRFSESHTVEAEALRVVPAGVDWRSAVCLDPADFALGAVRDGGVRVGDAVAVFGLGAIGLMVVQIARMAGASPVIAVDPLSRRRQVAAGLGADLTLDPTAVDAGREIKASTSGRGVDVAIEYSGNAAALQAALRGIGFRGTVVAGAFPAPYPAGLDFGAEAHLNIPRIVFSRANSEPGRDDPRWTEARLYDTCWRWICDGRLRGESVVDPVVPFDDLPGAYEMILSAPEGAIKLGAQR